MPYLVTVFEPQADQRDIKNLAHMGQTHRTAVVESAKRDAIDRARQLLSQYAEVKIWYERRGVGKPVNDWLPEGTVILSNVRGIRVEYYRKASRDRRRRVDWHLYEYKGSDGEIYRKAFETIRGESPQIPHFGTSAAISALALQWECFDCRGTGWSGGAYEINCEGCWTCGGSGQRKEK